MLSDNLWITRKTRIYSELRLERNAKISKFIITLYSFYLIIFSIWNLNHNNPQISELLVFSSIGIALASISLSAQRYAYRALDMRNCYIRLLELYNDAKRAEAAKNDRLIQKIESKYAQILGNIENHSEYDYLCFRFSIRNIKDSTLKIFNKCDYLVYFYEKIKRIFLIIFICVFPIITSILFSLVK